jgi:TRAP-type C4-dicarboxylate transport system permease small subunit
LNDTTGPRTAGVARPGAVRALDATSELLARVNAPLTRAGRTLAALLIVGMVALAVAPILARAAFDYALDWAEELARATLVWSVLTVLPYAYRHGTHVAIDSFAMALPPRLLLCVALAVNLLVMWVCGIFLVESLAFWQRGLTIVSSTMGYQVAWIYSVVPASFALMLVVGLELTLRLLRSLWAPDPHLALAGAVPGVIERPDGR